MELLYRSVIPRGTVHCVCWSGTNLVAVSVSVEVEGYVSESYDVARNHQLLLLDPNRPWDFHTIAPECKSAVIQLDWSLDGSRLLALDESGVTHMWRMRGHCLNSWVCAHKDEPPSTGDKIVHISWLDHKPMVTINHMKQEWREVMEVQHYSPHIQTLLGNGFITIFNNGNVRVTSTSGYHVSEISSAETALGGCRTITTAKTFVTPSGAVLCIAGYTGGQVKVHSLMASLRYGGDFTIASSLATEFHPIGSANDKISELLVLPHADGCIVHVCYNETELYQWSVKDITRSGSYQAKRDRVHTSPQNIVSMVGSAVCLGSCDAASENDLMVLDEVSDTQNEDKWPVEVVIVVREGGEIGILHRESFKVLQTLRLSEEDSAHPASKRARLDGSCSQPTHTVCLSPNACCAAVASGNSIQLIQLGPTVLCLKDASTPEVPRCSRLLSLAIAMGQSPWDIAVVCGRLENKKGEGLVKMVLEHFLEDFDSSATTMREQLIAQFLNACSMLHSCLDDGLVGALTYRDMARLYGTAALMNLSLTLLPNSDSDDKSLSGRLEDTCRDNASEESLEAITCRLEIKDFCVATDSVSQLQGHVHWVIEFSIRVVSAMVAKKQTPIPSISCLKLLRQCLVLIYIWNKAMPQPIISITDGALSLLFKSLTRHIQSPTTALSDDLQTEISSNIPSEKHPHLLTLTRAAHLQGFLNGIVSSPLPEAFQREMAPRIRPHVQRHYTSTDPYSPLTLVVPKALSPPWRDCFVEGQRDVVHSGTLMKAVLQNANLKQCNSCRGWTVAPEGLHSSDGAELKFTVQQWRTAWSGNCLCGGLWTLRPSSSKRN